MQSKTKDNWVDTEFSKMSCGDKRLNTRLKSLVHSFFTRPNSSIPNSCKGWDETKAAYRFFANEKISKEKILNCHKECSIERIAKEPIVLLVQDTTEINYNSREKINSLGPLNKKNQQGFRLHPTIGFTPDNVCLGVVDAKYMVRDKLGKKSERSKRPIEEKESYRWIESYNLSNDIAHQCSDSVIINIGDREGDIYELFLEANKESSKAELIVRSDHNRKLSNEDKKLRQKLSESEVVGEISFVMQGNKNRKKRKVTQEIRCQKLRLRPPANKKKLPDITISAIFCKEVTPAHGEKPLEWLIITTLNTQDKRFNPSQIVSYYLSRWQIEIFFKVLKSGCKIEELQLKDFKRISVCISLYLIIAWRILFLTMIGRICPDLSADQLFEEFEWKAAYMVYYKKPPPLIPPKLNEIINIIASFGGFLHRKYDRTPGIKYMWIGIQRLKDFALALQIASTCG